MGGLCCSTSGHLNNLPATAGGTDSIGASPQPTRYRGRIKLVSTTHIGGWATALSVELRQLILLSAISVKVQAIL
jgi:hypothetical protein